MRKRSTIVTAIPLALAGIVGASAWVSASGSGDTNVQTSQIKKLEVIVAQEGTDTLDFGDSQKVDFSAHNPNKGAVNVNQVQIGIKPSNTLCPAGSFILSYGSNNYKDGDVIPVGGVKIPGGAKTPVFTATLKFVEVDANQDACAGAPTKVSATVS